MRNSRRSDYNGNENNSHGETTLQHTEAYAEFSVPRYVYSDRYCFKNIETLKTDTLRPSGTRAKKNFPKHVSQTDAVDKSKPLLSTTDLPKFPRSDKNRPKFLLFPTKPPVYRRVFSKYTADVPGRFGRCARRIRR